MNLPERLKNLGIQAPPQKGEKVTVVLSDGQVQRFSEIFDRKESKGA